MKRADRSGLELEADGELQLPHVRAALERRDFAVVSARAVYATVGSVVLTEGVNRVIEDVECVHEELCPELFGDREGLRDRQIGIEASRTVVGIAAVVADQAAVRKSKRSCSRTRQSASIGSNRERV